MSYLVINEDRWLYMKDYYTPIAFMDYIAILKNDGTVEIYKNRRGGDKIISYEKHLENVQWLNEQQNPNKEKYKSPFAEYYEEN